MTDGDHENAASEPPRRPAYKRLLWRLASWIAPLPLAVYVNRRNLGGDGEPSPDLQPEDWVIHQQEALLDRSEERLRGIEAKGPALATSSAIVAAAIVVAISEAWGDATTLARVLLLASASYTALSLVTPIVLVGPQRRSTVTVEVLSEAVEKDYGKKGLAKWMADAAAKNDRLTLRLGNLQVASRNMLVIAIALLAAWGALTIVDHGVAKDGEGASFAGMSPTCDRLGGDEREQRAVFLVHGRDEARRREVKSFLEQHQRLPVVVLAEQAGRGDTVIEKLEAQACRARHAVVLYTGDDRGGLSGVGRLRRRARQNVVFELGFFYGLLSRDQVILLLEPGVELPSDLEGIAYVRLDDAGGWRTELATELGMLK